MLVADVEVSDDMLEQVCELQAIAACVLAFSIGSQLVPILRLWKVLNVAAYGYSPADG